MSMPPPQNATHQVLLALLAAWRATRDPTVAELVNNVSARFQPAPLAGKNGKEQHPDWLARAARYEPGELGLLLDTLIDKPYRLAGERMRALVHWPPDPRLGEFGVRAFEKPPLRSLDSSKPFWEALSECLHKHSDTNTLERLAAIDTNDEEWAKVTMARLLRARMRPVKERLQEKTPGRPIKNDELELCQTLYRRFDQGLETAELAAELKAIFGSLDNVYGVKGKAAQEASQQSNADQTEEGFRRQIMESPEDEELRLVFADWLIENNEPYGEFIQLQIQGAKDGISDDEKRRLNILKKHANASLGPLKPMVNLHESRFERGFLTHCYLNKMSSMKKERALAGDPRWATVRVLIQKIETNSRNQHYLLHPVMKELRLIDGFGAPALRKLALESPCPKIEEIGCHLGVPPWKEEVFPKPVQGALPQLKRLRLSVPLAHLEEGEWQKFLRSLLDWPLRQRLEELTLVTDRPTPGLFQGLSDWPALRQLTLSLDTFGYGMNIYPRRGEIDTLGRHITFERGLGERSFSRLRTPSAPRALEFADAEDRPKAEELAQQYGVEITGCN